MGWTGEWMSGSGTMGALDGKVAWITGAGTGIGQAGALALAREGAHVVLSGRTRQTLDATAGLVDGAGGRCSVEPLDVADKAAVARVAQSILAAHQRIDILVNSAGVNIRERTWGLLKPEGWDELLRINLDGTFYCCHAVLPSMRARRDGIVINISSWFGKYVNALAGPGYTASKFGAVALTETINLEEGANGIRACVVCPGEAATPIMERRPVKPPRHETDRMLQEEDLGRVIAFIATLPPRVCINEIIVSPTHNRFYVGGLESSTPKATT
jgi:NAD(P)-dependent dehydrogenase (short-subunit alcohol dehydrogenase family)